MRWGKFWYGCVLFGVLSVGLSSFGDARADVLGTFKDVRLLPGFIDPFLQSQVAKSKIPNGPEKFYPTQDRVDRRTPSQILVEYLLEDEIRPGHKRFNASRAEQFVAEVRERQKNAFLAFCSKKLPKKFSKDHDDCKSLKWTDFSLEETKEQKEKTPLNKFLKKWLRSASYRVHEFAIRQMKKAEDLARGSSSGACLVSSCPSVFDDLNRPEAQPFLEAFFSAVEASQLAQGEDPYWGTSTSKTIYYLRLAKTFVKNWELGDAGTRASNLLVPEELAKQYPNQVFFSPEQVVQLEKSGFDTSTLNPPESGLWRSPKASLASWDARTYNRQGVAALKNKLSEQELEDFLDPDRVIDVELLKVERGKGTTPKVPVQYGRGNQHWKMKFLTDKLAADSNMSPAIQMMRLILAGEVNVISAANNLAAMAGFTVDPTYFKRKVHLYLPEGNYDEAKFKEAIEEQVVAPLRDTANESWNVRSAFEAIGVDSNGRHYVEMKGVSFQKKTDSDSDANIGSFIRHGLGKEFKREYRALALFNVLLQDLDVKDGNLKAKLLKGTEGEEKIAFASADFGGTLGFGFPNIYFPDLVKEVVRDHGGNLAQIKLKHHSFFPMPIFKSITFSDAKWLLRLVNQIPENKIVEAFLSGGFPEPIAIYYKDLFLRRFEQLVDALGMTGQIYPGTDKELHEFSSRSLMKDPKTYSVKGYEKFFKGGKLSDPKNELFNPNKDAYPRDWGTGLSKEIDGHHKREFYKLMKNGIPLAMGNLVQSAMVNNFQFATTQFGANGVVEPFCRNRCFFSGFKAGVDWFIPTRFVIENPTETKIDRPYWVVDMFRLTVVLGYGSGDILQMLGSSIREQVMGLGGEFALGMDFIKIRPVKDYATALGHLKNNDEATRKFFFKNINEQVLSGMQEGDVLIGTHHLGARGSLLMETPALNQGALKPGFELGTEAFVANRTYTLKGADNHILVNWANLKTINVFADAYLRILFPRIPILEAEFKAGVQSNQVYDFDFKIKAAKEMLLSHINDPSPRKVDAQYRYQTKTVKYGSLRAMVNLFEIRKWNAILKRGHVTGEDLKTGQKVDELAYERVNSTRVLRAWSFFDRDFNTVRAQVDPKGDLFLKLDSHFYLSQAYKKDFIQFLKDYRSILPEDLVVFDPASVKSYLGDFESKASVVLDAEALEALFGGNGPSNDSLCQEYALANHHEPAGAWCQEVLGRPVLQPEKAGLKRFLHHFAKTRGLYRELFSKGKSLDFQKTGERLATYSLLRSMVFTFSVSGLPKGILDHLQKWIRNKNLFRTATLTSFLDGFPGQQEKVEISSKYKGKLELVGRYKTLQLEDSFKIFTDEIDRELRRRGLLDRTSIHYLR